MSDPTEEHLPNKPRQISRRTAIMSVGTTLSRATGFVRVAALTTALGITTLGDSYTLGNNTPNIVYELVLGGILSATLVPIFVSLQNNDDEDSAVGAILGLSLLVLIIVSALIFLCAPWIIQLYTLGNHSSRVKELRHTGSYLLRFFAPQILFYGFISVATALLNSRRKFAAPMFAPILNNVVVIGMFLAFHSIFSSAERNDVQHHHAPLAYLGILTTLGVVAMALPLFPAMKKTGISIRPRWNPRHPAIKKLVSLSGWTLGFVIANQITLLLVYALASRQQGGPIAYNVAFIFFLLPHGIFAVSVTSALQPELAQSWADKNFDQFKYDVSLGIRLIMIILIPAAVGYIMLARPIVHSALAYGAAKGSSINLVSGTIGWMVIGLPAYSIYLYLIGCFQAMHDTRTAFALYVLENGVNAFGALLVFHSLGVKGLALVFAIAYVVGAFAAFAVISRKVGGFPLDEIRNTFGRVFLASVALMAVLALVRIVSTLFDKSAPLTLFFGIIIGAPTYFIAGQIVGIREWDHFMKGPLARFAKDRP